MTASPFPHSDRTGAPQASLGQNVSKAADGADHRSVQAPIDAVASGVGQVRANAMPALQELAVGAGHMARDGAYAVRERALRLRAVSSDYVRGHPLQTVMIAAGVGAALALLLSMLTQRTPTR